MKKHKFLQTIFCFLIVDVTLQQEWDFYTEELINSFPTANWNNPEPALLTCNPVVPPFQQLWEFTGQVWQRQFNLESERGLAGISLQFDLIVLNAQSFILQNEINVEFDGEIQQIQEKYALISQDNYTFCSNEDRYFSIYMEFDVSEKALYNFIFEIQMNNPLIKYSIKNFIVYLQKCGENCFKCDSKLFRCKQCQPTYALVFLSKFCLCLPPLAFMYNNQCVQKCPNGFYAVKNNQGNICVLYAQKQQLLNYNDIIQNYSDIYIQDNLSNTYYQKNQQQHYNINRFNDKLLFSISKSQNTNQLVIEAEFEMLGDLSLYSAIDFKINSINLDSIKYYENHLNSQLGIITFHQTCTHQLFQKCIRVNYYLLVLGVETNDIEIQIEGNFNITDYQQAWSLMDLTISEIKTLPSPSPIVCTLIYDNECVTTCPKHSTLNGIVCEDYGSVYRNPFYAVKAFYSINQKQYCQEESLNFYINHLPLHYYKNRLIQQIQNTTIHYRFHSQSHKKIKFFISILLIDWQTTCSENYFLQIKFVQQKLNYLFCPDILNLINDIQIDQGFSDYLFSNFTIEFDHNLFNELEIEFYCNSPYNGQCGFFDFFLIFDKCNHGCQHCDLNNNCLTYSPSFPEQITYDQNNYQCMDGYYYEKNLQQCGFCEPGCLTCESAYYCLICKQNLLMVANKCYCPISKKRGDCNNEDSCSKKCQICHRKNINFCDSCDITELKIQSLNQCECIYGYFMNSEFICTKCSETCWTCSDFQVCTSCTAVSNRELIDKYCQCKQGYFENKNEVICKPCDGLCKQCSIKSDHCNACFTEQFRVLSHHICICQIGYYEDNAICKQCNPNCESCQAYDKCSSCKVSDHKRLLQNKCICSLGYYENQYNECQSCHYSCSRCNFSDAFNQCTECPFSRIKANSGLEVFSCKCLKGYYDIEQLECINCNSLTSVPIDHICYSNCGDKIVQWNEECDDGNMEPRDGCDQCYYQSANCDPSVCKTCTRGQCSVCLDGYYLNQANLCEQCSQNCITCTKKKDNCTICRFLNADSTCKLCDLDKGQAIVQNTCVSICGDHLKVLPEGCDDGNINNGDGCNSQCQIEDGFICNDVCELMIPIQMIVSTDQTDKYFENQRSFKLEFNQLIVIQGNLTDMISISNSNNVTITKQSEGDQVVLIKIKFYETIINPIIELTLNPKQNITNAQGIELSNNTVQIQLISYLKQSESTITVVNSSVGFANYIIYLLIGLAAFSLLTGGLNIFLNLLDSLQTLAYLKYFNLQYPFNVDLYFSIFGFAEFDFLKEYIAVNIQLFDSMEQISPDQKFVEEGYTSLFLINILSVATVFATTFGIFIFSRLMYQCSDWILQNLSNSITKDIYYTENKLTYYLYQSIKYIRKQCGETNQQLKNSLILTFMASTMDLHMAIFLQLKTYGNGVQISYLLSFIIFFFEMIFIYRCFNIIYKPNYEVMTRAYKSQYMALQEGVKQKFNPVIKIYQIVNLMKKMMFMFCLIFLYSAPLIQVGVASLLNIAFIGYLTLSNPLEDRIEYQKVTISESILWLEQLLVMLMIYISNQYEESIQVNQILGWIMIGLSSLLLISQLIIDIKQHFSFLYEQYKILQNIIAYVSKIFRNKDESRETEILFKSTIQTYNLSRKYY